MDVRLPFGPQAARTARRLVDEVLVEADASPEVRDDAALVVHELVMNGVVHGRPDADGELGLRYELVDRRLFITVVDQGTSGVVSAREPDEESPSGRGLHMVAALASDWWVDRTHGTAVSARLDL